MASKVTKAARPTGIRCFRRSQNVLENDTKCDAKGSQVSNNCSEEQCAIGNDNKSQQLKEKNDMGCGSTHNNDGSSMSMRQEPARRITRGFNQQISRGQCDSQMQQEPVTPEEQPVQQMEAEETCVRVNDESIQAKGPVELHGDIVCTIRKSFRSREMISPYSQNPKSYRKAHKKELDSIPYRKCYDNFEARIVLILNKLHDGKNSQKDLELLVEKMQKISPKELLNRYIISGIVAIIRLASDQNIYPSELVTRIQQEHRHLLQRIQQELNRDDYYDTELAQPTDEHFDTKDYQNPLKKRVYCILKKRSPSMTKCQLRELTLRLCDNFFRGDTSIEGAINFIRAVGGECSS